jgi:hypothetical protein
VSSSEAAAFRKSVSDQRLTLIDSRKFGLTGMLLSSRGARRWIFIRLPGRFGAAYCLPQQEIGQTFACPAQVFRLAPLPHCRTHAWRGDVFAQMVQPLLSDRKLGLVAGCMKHQSKLVR